ncbi:MAG: C40 family peptidase [Lachnospiraceae bacterium]|nr:C40 family peptidase [Lachnospiraceae bacterium]
MKKSTVRFMVCAVASAIAVAGYGITVCAGGDVINEEEISITSALDQYIAAHQGELTPDGGAQDVPVSGDSAAQAPGETAGDTTTEAATEAPMSTAQYPEFEGKALANVSGNLNIRAAAGEDAERIGKLPAGAVATVISTENGWTQIKSGSVTGYVKTDYLVFGDEAGAYAEKNLPKMAVIETTTLKVREKKSTDSACVTMVPGGEEYAILEQFDEWTEIEIDDATTGFVSNEYIDVTYSLATAVSIDEEFDEEEEDSQQDNAGGDSDKKDSNKKDDSKKDNNKKDDSKKDSDKKDNKKDDSKKDSDSSNKKTSGTRSDIVNYALQFVGNPYVYGGSSLTKGTDCSGFTMSVYKHFGYSLPHNSSAQAGCGKKVSVSDVQPGDLLFYGNGKGISHVALYIGNGQVVHASSRKTGIKISKYNYKTPKCAVSILD